MSLLQARGLSWGGDHHGWVPSPTGEDLLGDGFISVGLTRNPGLSPGNLSKQHFVETGSLLPKRKNQPVLVLPNRHFLTQENMLSKNFPTTLLGMCSLPSVPKAGALEC